MKRLMSIIYIYLFIILLFSQLVNSDIAYIFDTEIKCTLSGMQDYKPFPSLSRCYKHNKSSCCNSVNDDYIDGVLVNLLTHSCDRRFPALEDLFCLSCNPLESIYSNSTTKTIYICEDYAQYFWNQTDLSIPSPIFDGCGFHVTEALQTLTESNFILPSQIFNNFTDFLTKIKVPYYEDYTYQIVPINDTSTNCFGTVSSNYIGIGKNFFFLIVIFFVFFELFIY